MNVRPLRPVIMVSQTSRVLDFTPNPTARIALHYPMFPQSRLYGPLPHPILRPHTNGLRFQSPPGGAVLIKTSKEGGWVYGLPE
jgi:hypothetical protein